jgi:hypothetical protein
MKEGLLHSELIPHSKFRTPHSKGSAGASPYRVRFCQLPINN